MQQERIEFSLKGGNVEAIRLDEFAVILQSYQRMLDRSFLAYEGRERAGNFQRENFHASLQSWKKGSIIMDVLLHAPGFAQTSFMANPIPINPISCLMEAVMMFYRMRDYMWKKYGHAPKVEIGGDNNAPINVVSGSNNVITINHIVKNGTDMLEGPAGKIINLVEKNSIEEFSSRPLSVGGEAQGFTIASSDVGILDPVTDRTTEAEGMMVNIFQFNKKSGNGKLQIIESASIESGRELSFWAEEVRVSYDAIASALRKSVKRTPIAATKEFYYYPSGECKISYLTIKTVG